MIRLKFNHMTKSLTIDKTLYIKYTYHLKKRIESEPIDYVFVFNLDKLYYYNSQLNSKNNFPCFFL